MASNVTYVVQTGNALTGISGTLASQTYGVTAAYNCSTNKPYDVIVQVAFTPGTVTGSKQGMVFLKESWDGGTNYRTGPESGTTATDEPDLLLLGAIPLYTNSTLQRGSFSVRASLGNIPTHVKFVGKNESGAAFSAVTVTTFEVFQVVG